MANEQKATAKAEPKVNGTVAKSPDKGDGGAAEVQAKVDKIDEQGFAGVEVDITPNENYTLAGVCKGLPTPETDEDQAAKVDAHARKLGTDPFKGQ